MSASGASQADMLQCVHRLIQLAEQMNKVLRLKQHAQLLAIVQTEEEALSALQQVQLVRAESAVASGNGVSTPTRSTSITELLAEAITELQRLNSMNAALLQEYLTGVTRCLELLTTSQMPTYSVGGKHHTDTSVQRMLDVTG
jgi:flagellar biosynthesis/type III secretory pathway chaperone